MPSWCGTQLSHERVFMACYLVKNMDKFTLPLCFTFIVIYAMFRRYDLITLPLHTTNINEIPGQYNQMYCSWT
jgi:hypothetical protein